MLNPDFTIVIQIVNFLFLLLILNIVLYRPIRNILSRRNEKMNAFQTTIEDFQGKSARSEKDLEENVTAARKAGDNEKEAIKSAGLGEETGLLQEASSQADEKIGKARGEIEERRADTRQKLEKEVEAFSQALVEKIFGRSV